MGLTKEQLENLLQWFKNVNRIAGDGNPSRVRYFRMSLFPAMAAACKLYDVPAPNWLVKYGNGPLAILMQKANTVGFNSTHHQVRIKNCGTKVLLVRSTLMDGPFDTFISKCVDDDHINTRRSEVAKCKHAREERCDIAGSGGFRYPGLYCPDCGRVRTKNRRHHSFTSAAAPMIKAINAMACTSDWRPDIVEKANFNIQQKRDHHGRWTNVAKIDAWKERLRYGVMDDLHDRPSEELYDFRHDGWLLPSGYAVELKQASHGEDARWLLWRNDETNYFKELPKNHYERQSIAENGGHDIDHMLELTGAIRVNQSYGDGLNISFEKITPSQMQAIEENSDQYPDDLITWDHGRSGGRGTFDDFRRFVRSNGALNKSVSRISITKAVAEGCYHNPAACGLRWITAHPNGEEPGVPLLVHDNGEEYTVVGGAGGRMNQQVFKKPVGQKDPKKAARRERAIARKKARIEAMGEDAERLRETAQQLNQVAKEKMQEAYDKVLAKLQGSMSGDDALATVQDEAKKRSVKENANASPEEQAEFADQAAKAAVTEAHSAAKNALKQLLDKAALQAIGDDVSGGTKLEVAMAGKKILRDMPQDEMDELVGLVAQASEAKGKEKAIQRALRTGDQESVQGIEADVRPLSLEEAHQRNLDRYLNEQDVDNQTALVQASCDSPDRTRNRNMANGTMDGLNSFTASLTGKACLRPDLCKTLGVEDAARVAAAYLEEQGVDTASTAEHLRDRIGSQSAASVAAAIDKVREMDAMVQVAKDASKADDGAVTVGQASILAANMANMKYRFLNITRGQLRGAAALAHHLEHPSQRPLKVNGGSSATSAHALAKSLGLNDGDYSVEKAERGTGGGYKVIVQPDNIAKLASTHSLAESNRNVAMDQLRQEIEEGTGDWRPSGINDNILLQQHQELGARAAVQQKRLILNYEAGTGKTPTFYAAAAHALADGKIDRALLTMPASVVAQQNDYEDIDDKGNKVKKKGEAEKFLTPDLRAQTMIADSSNWKKVVAAVKSGACKIMVCTPDMLRNHADELVDAGFGAGRSMFIADEAHKLAIGEGEGSGSGMAQSARKLSSSEYFLAGSGTLIENNASELWSTLDMARPGEFGSQQDFTRQWQRLSQGSRDLFTSESMKGMRDRLSGVMCSYFKPVKGENGEALENHENTVTVKTSPAQKAAIKKINDKYAKDRRSEDPAIKKAAALTRDAAVFRVLTKGVKKADGTIDNPKLQALSDIMEDEKARDPKNRIGIYSRELEPLRAAKSHLAGRKIHSLTGSETADEKRATINAANDREGNCDGVALSDSGATGVNLQGLDHMVLLHGTQTPSLYQQIAHRHFRKGAKTNKRTTVVLTDSLQEQYRNWRVTRVKKAESDLLSQLADDHGYAGVLARHIPAVEEAAGEKL